MQNSKWVTLVLVLGALVLAHGEALGKKGGGGGGGPGGGDEDPPNTTPLDIAFRTRSGNLLYLIQDDGTGAVSFPGAGSVDGRVTWSPDGTELAFWSDADGEGIYVMAADGTEIRKVVATNASAVGFCTVAWSPAPAPDGKYKLAYLDLPDSGAGSPYTDLEIFVVNLDGTGRTNVTQNSYGEQSVSWSPDGAKLVTDYNSTIAILDFSRPTTDGLPSWWSVYSATTLRPSGAEWAKTGDRIVFSAYDSSVSGSGELCDLHVIDVEFTGGAWSGSSPLNITNTPDDAEYTPSWSPDDEWIACENRYIKPNRNGRVMTTLAVVPVGSGQRRTLLDDSDGLHPVWKRSAP